MKVNEYDGVVDGMAHYCSLQMIYAQLMCLTFYAIKTQIIEYQCFDLIGAQIILTI